MKISIIIPVHNAEKELRSCVESIALQEYASAEIILVENNSTDKSWEICQELARYNSNIICLRTSAVGPSAARNLGLQHATGEIIGFADADDMLREGILGRITKAFAQNPDCSGVGFGFEKVYPDRESQQYCVRKGRKLSFYKMICHVLCNAKVSGYVWNKYWRAEVLKDICFQEDLTHSEDTHFVIHVMHFHPRKMMYLLPELGYDYYQHPNTLTSRAEVSFDREGQCKMITASYRLLQDFRFRGYFRLLVRRVMFSMASSQYLRFREELLPDQRSKLKAEMYKNMGCYLLTFYIAPLESAKRLVRLALSCWG